MKFLVLCDANLIRDSFCNLLKNLEIGDSLEVLAAATLDMASTLIEQQPDLNLILYYHALNDKAWLELQDLVDRTNNTPIMVVADFHSDKEVRRAILEGANGCVSTDFTWRTVSTVIQRIMEGGIVCPSLNFNPGHAESVVEENPSKRSEPVSSPTPPIADKSATMQSLQALDFEGGLTPRQTEVLDLIRMGKSNKQIARVLNVAEGTVKIHCAAIFRFLGVTNRTQAALAAEAYFRDNASHS